MASHHVLLLGGHGKVASLLTPLLLQRSWAVTSIVRDAAQVPVVEKLDAGQTGRLTVLARSLEDVKAETQARALIEEVNPDYIVWSAGAGGKGGPERTLSVDRDAAIFFIHAAAATQSVTRFLMISYLASRRSRPPWWDEAAWAHAEAINAGALKTYYEAKISADEALYAASKQRPGFVGINLRPGSLTSGPAAKVELGRTKSPKGEVSRESVAVVASLLLGSDGVRNSWLDLLDGDEDVDAAVERVVMERVDAAKGEPVH